MLIAWVVPILVPHAMPVVVWLAIPPSIGINQAHHVYVMMVTSMMVPINCVSPANLPVEPVLMAQNVLHATHLSSGSWAEPQSCANASPTTTKPHLKSASPVNTIVFPVETIFNAWPVMLLSLDNLKVQLWIVCAWTDTSMMEAMLYVRVVCMIALGVRVPVSAHNVIQLSIDNSPLIRDANALMDINRLHNYANCVIIVAWLVLLEHLLHVRLVIPPKIE